LSPRTFSIYFFF